VLAVAINTAVLSEAAVGLPAGEVQGRSRGAATEVAEVRGCGGVGRKRRRGAADGDAEVMEGGWGRRGRRHGAVHGVVESGGGGEAVVPASQCQRTRG